MTAWMRAGRTAGSPSRLARRPFTCASRRRGRRTMMSRFLIRSGRAKLIGPLAAISSSRPTWSPCVRHQRPPAEFQRMIEPGTSKPAPLEIVIVHSFSRFFHDHFELGFYVRKLAKNGVKLLSISQVRSSVLRWRSKRDSNPRSVSRTSRSLPRKGECRSGRTRQSRKPLSS